MTRGRPHWTTLVPPAELQAIHETLDAADGASVRDVYDRLNLRRYCSARTLRHYAAQRARDRQHRRALAPESRDGAPTTPAVLRSRVIDEISRAIASGSIPPYALPNVLRAVLAIDEVELRRQADERAEELHERRLAEQDKALTATAAQTRLTDEQVREIRERVLGL